METTRTHIITFYVNVANVFTASADTELHLSKISTLLFAFFFLSPVPPEGKISLFVAKCLTAV